MSVTVCSHGSPHTRVRCKTHSLLCSFSWHMFGSTYFVPGSVLGTGDIEVAQSHLLAWKGWPVEEHLQRECSVTNATEKLAGNREGLSLLVTDEGRGHRAVSPLNLFLLDEEFFRWTACGGNRSQSKQQGLVCQQVHWKPLKCWEMLLCAHLWTTLRPILPS